MQDVNYDGSLVLKPYFPAHQTNEVKAVFLIQQHYMEYQKEITRATSTNYPRYCTVISTVGYFVLQKNLVNRVKGWLFLRSVKKKRKVFFFSSRAQDKENIPHEESNLKPSDSALRCFTTEPQRLYGKQFPLRSSYMTRVQHTARISNVVGVMFCKQDKKDKK